MSDDRPSNREQMLLSFWRWAYSDLISNANRGVLAEFLVARALGVSDAPRVEWDEADIRYQGKRIEVKTSGRVQSWHAISRPKKLAVQFDIEPKQGWDATTGAIRTVPGRCADCYVFCFHSEDGPADTLDPLDPSGWELHVVPTSILNERFPLQKRLGLEPLRRLDCKTTFAELSAAVDRALAVAAAPAPAHVVGLAAK
jgi:hypothetical protein